MSILNFWKIKRRLWVEEDISLPYDVIAEGYMDSGVVNMDYFYKNSKNRFIIYSAGIGDQINFELDILRKLEARKIPVELYAFDPTPKSLDFLSHQNLPVNFHVFPYAISNKDEMLEFALSQSEGWVSGSAEDVVQDARNYDFNNKIQVEGRSIESIMKELGHTSVDLLKMDIEGSEFTALEAVLGSNLHIAQMCIDHHEHMFKNGNDKLIRLLELLREKEYKIFYTEKNPKENRGFSCIRMPE